MFESEMGEGSRQWRNHHEKAKGNIICLGGSTDKKFKGPSCRLFQKLENKSTVSLVVAPMGQEEAEGVVLFLCV